MVAINSAGGNWADMAIIPARQARPIPDDIPDEQAACFFVNPATVLAMARHVLAVPKGDWLLQSAAGSTLGRMLINLGRHDGFKTLNVVRRREAIDELKKLGGDAVISSSDGPIDEQVRQITGGDGAALRRRPCRRRDRNRRLSFAGARGPARSLRHIVGRADHRRPSAGDLGPAIRRGVLAGPLDAPAFHPLGPALFREIAALIRKGVLRSEIGEVLSAGRDQGRGPPGRNCRAARQSPRQAGGWTLIRSAGRQIRPQ